ncbi:hypothetical protein EV421DRAFT_1747225 [Armillaria borealis]|uniref:Uncharacterized protein n=1 Tax=Armillaria borealis TaxID=47425 RepID=A0AA39IBX1_9AGAR|nr:hypothetical protein EV421DRAFT_1747225 [Armillaria borealis]
MSTSAAQAIPSLVSLVTRADNVMRHPLELNALLPRVTAYFDEAAKVKFFIETYYPSALNEIFFKNFESVVEGCISRFNSIESDRIKASVSGRYSISGNQIVDAFATLPPLRIRVDDDIQMSSAPFTPVLATSKEVQTAPVSSDAASASASKDPEPEIREETPLRDTGAMSPSTVSSADWVLPSPVAAAPAPFIEQFAEKEGTLKDAVEIGEKITDLYRRSFNKADLRYGDSFCAYCSGTPSHPAHRCPARSAKAVRPCGPCVREGTECNFAGLSSECAACHKSVTRNCVGGIPDRQILLVPFNDPHPEDDDHLLDIIDELMDADPYGAKPPAGIPDDPHTEAIVDNAKSYVGANFQQFSPHGPESVGSLVKTKEAYLQRLETNTRELYLGLKTRHVLVQHYRLVTVKLDEARIQEEAEANTAAKMRNDNRASSSSYNHNGHWWRRKHQRNSRGHGKKNRSQNKSKGKKDDQKGKGKDEAAQYIKECIGWGCDHDNCDSNQETQDDVQGVCDCRGWGSCGHPACPSRQGGSWGQTDLNVNQYQDNGNGYGNYSGGWGKASGSKASGSKRGRHSY